MAAKRLTKRPFARNQITFTKCFSVLGPIVVLLKEQLLKRSNGRSYTVVFMGFSRVKPFKKLIKYTDEHCKSLFSSISPRHLTQKKI